MLRRSERLLKKLYSLPVCESESENEADEDADLELDELRYAEQDDDLREDDDDERQDRIDVEEDDIESDEDDVQMEDSDLEETNDKWHQNTQHLDELPAELEILQNPSAAIEIEIEQDDDEIEYFNKIWDDEMNAKIVEETNLYAREKQSKNWVDVTVPELKAFFGCLIIMGIHRLPSLKCYWSSNPLLHVESVASVMPANRYRKITQNLHCNNNNFILPKNHKQHDKLHKLRPLLDCLNKNIGKIYRPSNYVVIDESMIAFKGRSFLKQYMPLPVTCWIKIFMLVVLCAQHQKTCRHS